MEEPTALATPPSTTTTETAPISDVVIKPADEETTQILKAKIADVPQVPATPIQHATPQAAHEPTHVTKQPNDKTKLAVVATVVIVVAIAALMVVAFIMTSK